MKSKAERVYELVAKEIADDKIEDLIELIDLCEYLNRESPRAIAVRVLDYLVKQRKRCE